MALNIVEKDVNGVTVLELAGRVTLGEGSAEQGRLVRRAERFR